MLKAESFGLRRVDVRFFAVLAFVVPFVVRLVPELLMGGFVVGFDTVSYYVPVTLRWAQGGVGFFEALAYAPLFYLVLAWLTSVGVPLTISLKILPPVLLGFLGLAVYGYARRGLGWSDWKSVAVAVLATLYFVSLRISWDMLRSVFALVFLFVFLIVLHESEGKRFLKGLVLVSPVMVLTVLSQQLVSVVLFAVVSALVLQRLLSGERVRARDLVLWSIPAVAVFGLVVYSQFVISPGFSVVVGFPSRSAGGWFSLFGFDSYATLVANAAGFVLFCCVLLLPFAYLGWKRVKRADLYAWFVFCLAAALSAVVSPSAFVLGGYRWTLLLVFPLAFFAIEGLSGLKEKVWRHMFVLSMVFLSLSFVVLPTEEAFPFFRAFPNYVPSSMLQNSVSLEDCQDVVNVLSRYDSDFGASGVLMVHDAFQGWAQLLLSDRSRIVSYGYNDSESFARRLVSQGLGRVYMVWWVSGDGWHGVKTLPCSFVEVYRSGRMALYVFRSD